MFNQEQLAAIAAAMSVLQHSMQSNTPNTNSNSTNNNISGANSNSGNNSNNNQHHHQLADQLHLNNHLHHNNHLDHLDYRHLQQQQQQQQQGVASGLQTELRALASLDFLANHHAAAAAAADAAAAAAASNHTMQATDPLEQHPNPFKSSSLSASLAGVDSIVEVAKHNRAMNGPVGGVEHHQLSGRGIRGQHEGLDFLSSLVGANGPQDSLTRQAEANKLVNQYHSQQMQLQQQEQLQLAPSPPKQQPQPLQLPLANNQYHSQFNRQDLSLSPSPPKQHQLDQQQQAQVNHYRSQLRQQQQQLPLSDIAISQAPSKVLQQQYQQQQQQQQQLQLILADQYKAQLERQKLQQQQDLHIAPQSQKGLQLQQQQPVVSEKPNKPVSYSAVVAKSSGISSSNGVGPNSVASSNSVNASLSNLSNHNHNLNHNTSNNNHNHSTYSATATSFDTSGVRSQTTTTTTANNLQSINSNHAFRGLGASNGLPAKSPLINQNTSSSLFGGNNASNLAGNGLGHSNGSIISHHHNNHLQQQQQHLQSGSLALDQPTSNLINNHYTTDHSTSPARQLFHQARQNLSLQPQHNQSSNNNVTHANPNANLSSSTSSNSNHNTNSNSTNNSSNNSSLKPSPGSATNLLGFMGLYVGNLSPDLTKEQLEKIFSKYGEPVKAHRLIRSPVAFIKYENTESPRAAIEDLYGLLLPELTLNQDQPLKLHFDRNDTQLKANYRPTELPPKADNGECYGWRTTVCRRGKNCPKKHIPINRGIDFQMWMIKSTSGTTTSS